MNYGESASVTCNIISGDLPIDIEWFFNGKPLTRYHHELDKLKVADFGKRTKALSIDEVDARYAGLYSCKATNVASSVEYSHELIVNGRYHRWGSYKLRFASFNPMPIPSPYQVVFRRQGVGQCLGSHSFVVLRYSSTQDSTVHVWR